jgi:hypothetical protein
MQNKNNKTAEVSQENDERLPDFDPQVSLFKRNNVRLSGRKFELSKFWQVVGEARSPRRRAQTGIS